MNDVMATDVQQLPNTSVVAAATPIEDLANGIDATLSSLIRTVVFGVNTLALPLWWLGFPITFPLYGALTQPTYGVQVVFGWLLGPLYTAIAFADRLAPGIGSVIRQFLSPPTAPAASASDNPSSELAAISDDIEAPQSASGNNREQPEGAIAAGAATPTLSRRLSQAARDVARLSDENHIPSIEVTREIDGPGEAKSDDAVSEASTTDSSTGEVTSTGTTPTPGGHAGPLREAAKKARAVADRGELRSRD